MLIIRQSSIASISDKLNKSIKNAITKKETFVAQEAEYQDKLIDARKNAKPCSKKMMDDEFYMPYN